MDKLSSNIKGKLNEFQKNNPGGSSPFYVSQMAADFAKADKPAKPIKKSLGRN